MTPLPTTSVRGESKFEKCTLSVKVTFRGWGSNSIDALSGIHVSLISKSILILTEILTLRGQGVGGSEDNVSLTLSVHFSNFDPPLMVIIPCRKKAHQCMDHSLVVPKFV